MEFDYLNSTVAVIVLTLFKKLQVKKCRDRACAERTQHYVSLLHDIILLLMGLGEEIFYSSETKLNRIQVGPVYLD